LEGIDRALQRGDQDFVCLDPSRERRKPTSLRSSSATAATAATAASSTFLSPSRRADRNRKQDAANHSDALFHSLPPLFEHFANRLTSRSWPRNFSQIASLMIASPVVPVRQLPQSEKFRLATIPL
jgi:hypothetical protein